MNAYLIWHREREHYYLALKINYVYNADPCVSLQEIAMFLKIDYKYLKENLKICNGKIKQGYRDKYGYYGNNVCYFKQKDDGDEFIEKFINPIIVAQVLIGIV